MGFNSEDMYRTYKVHSANSSFMKSGSKSDAKLNEFGELAIVKKNRKFLISPTSDIRNKGSTKSSPLSSYRPVESSEELKNKITKIDIKSCKTQGKEKN